MAHKWDVPGDGGVDFDCPFGVPWKGVQASTVPASSPVAVRAPREATWAELHTHAAPTRAWLDQFSRRVRCGDCRTHWLAYVAANPPPADGDAMAWFAWGVAAHNAVNARLAKPILTIDQAMDIWKHNE